MNKKFKKGVDVVYVPSHANGDVEHKDCEYGIVTSTNHKYVFVNFGIDFMSMKLCHPRIGTSQACRPEDLMLTEEVDFIKGI